LGIVTPSISPGVNFPSENLFSQITSKLPKIDLSEVDPVKSLGNVTAPLDKIWEALVNKLNLDTLKNFLGDDSNEPSGEASKWGLEGLSGLKDTFSGELTMGKIFEAVKDIFIFAVNIFVIILEILLGLFKSLAGLIT